MNPKSQVCRTDTLYHYLFRPSAEVHASILEHGLRPLSDFPESERWQAIQEARPGFFEWVYQYMAKEVINKPYVNSGVFITPIDFRLLPDTYLHDKPRFAIPLSRIDSEWACISYEIEDRISLPLTAESMQSVAEFWTAEKVREWFARDNTRVFFHVPQVVTYQSGGIPIRPEEYEEFTSQEG
jgi:hypothetical protein